MRPPQSCPGLRPMVSATENPVSFSIDFVAYKIRACGSVIKKQPEIFSINSFKTSSSTGSFFRRLLISSFIQIFGKKSAPCFGTEIKSEEKQYGQNLIKDKKGIGYCSTAAFNGNGKIFNGNKTNEGNKQ